MRRILVSLLFLNTVFTGAFGQLQKPEQLSPSEIHQRIKKLNFLGTALYVAAHPDDENTRLISYLDNEVMAVTTYLSLTRGDGGQNLIGPEIRELLGVIRTQELLMARSIDGGDQLFSRANDFGYSKHPDETMAIWDREEVLSDMVRAIRMLKPDIIINRFSAESAGETHGHHTASAILALDAFELSGNSTAYPDQLKSLEPWQSRRIFFNTSWWFYGSQEAFDQADKSDMVSVDAGVYYPWLGKSNSEIAAESRSMHKCQGFGSTGTRGSAMEYLQLLKGDMPDKAGDLFAGINTTWRRVKGGAPIGELVGKIEKEFDFRHPERSLPDLFKAADMISGIEDEFWKSLKLEEISGIILACSGTYLEAVASDQYVTPGSSLKVKLEAINRSPAQLELGSVKFGQGVKDTLIDAVLSANTSNSFTFSIQVPENAEFTAPFWLRKPGTLGMYRTDNPEWRGQPVSPPAIPVRFELRFGGSSIFIDRELVYKFNDPEDGEIYRPLEIVPEASVGIVNKVVVFPDRMPRPLDVKVRADVEGFEGRLSLKMPAGWRSEPEFHSVELTVKGEERNFSFVITPPEGQAEVLIQPVLQSGSKSYSDELIRIEYDHIPFQTVLMPAQSKLVKLDLKSSGGLVGYVEGAGDEIPQCIGQLGYQVEFIDLANVSAKDLAKYPSIIMGVRAYNKLEELSYKHADLMEYVNQGGTLIIQYNTNRGLKSDVGPYPIKISRERVTVEEAEIRILAPDHPVLNSPNTIRAADFENWVQERGLYFASEWAPEYTALFSSNDPGEPVREGGLLVAEHGKGHFVYSGYSWFRQLPAGVPGAYRIFVNLIEWGRNE